MCLPLQPGIALREQHSFEKQLKHFVKRKKEKKEKKMKKMEQADLGKLKKKNKLFSLLFYGSLPTPKKIVLPLLQGSKSKTCSAFFFFVPPVHTAHVPWTAKHSIRIDWDS